MITLWAAVALVIFFVGLFLIAWCDGRGELDMELDELIMGVVFIAALWPVILGCAAVISPFVGFYLLIKKISSATKR
jgi:hypothetical protein